MAAGEEIDLTGLDKQIKDVQNDIQKLSKNFNDATRVIARFGDTAEQTAIERFRKGLSALSKDFSTMQKSIEKGDFGGIATKMGNVTGRLRDLSEAAQHVDMTNVIEQLNKISSQIIGGSKNDIWSKIVDVWNKNKQAAQQTANAEQQVAQSTSKAASETQKQAAAQQNVAEAANKTAANTRKVLGSAQSLGKVLQQIQEKKVLFGDQSAIQSYLKQEKSIKRINNALAGLRAAQEQCNLATKQGQQEYAKLGQQIKSLEFMLGRNANIAERLSSAFSKSKSMVEQLAMSFGVMTGVFGATNFVKQLYKITAEFQLQQRALGAIIQNTREANVLFKQMQSLAVESPMKFMDLNRYAKQLAAFRIETTNLYDSLKMLGDIAVGVGVDMDRLILAYGQVKAANYLRGQELRQFSEAGVNILGGLQEYYRETKNINMSINEIFDSVSKRKVLFEDVDAVLHRMTQSGGEFYNMQLIQSQTLYGQLQKLGDLFQISMNNIGNSTSGVLLKIITSIQFLIRHLREVVSVLVAMAGAAAMNKLIRNFAALRAGAQSLAISLREGWQVARALGATRLTAFTTALWNANAGMVALNAAISIGLVAFSLWMAKRQEQKAKQEEIQRALLEEITEYNKRLSEVRNLEKAYDKDSSFEGRLALLQQLIEKAKEYRLALKIDENVTPANINENFENAKKQLEEYTEQVLLFKNALYTTDVNEALAGLNSVNIEFANATLSAKKMIEALSNVYDTLSDKQKESLNEIKDIDKAFLENDEEFLKNIEYTYEQWQVKRLEKLNELAATATSAEGEKSRWFGGSQLEGLKEAQEKQFDASVSNLREFTSKYNKELEKATNALRPKMENIITADDFANLDEEEIKKKVAENATAIIDALNEAGEFAKQNIPEILQKLWELDKENSVSVAKVLVDIEEAKTNATNTRLQRFIDDVAQSDENGFVKTLTYDIKIEQTGDIPAFVGTAEQAEQQGIINKKKKEELETTMQIVNAVQKTIGGEKEKKKVFDDEYKIYKEQLKMIKRAIAYGLDEQTVLEGINAQLGTSFASLFGAQNVIETILKNGETLAKLLSWEIPTTTTSNRTQSMKSEYQSMIDFVRELNREFDTLRKNFNEKDSAKWAGATNRILSSFDAKFGAMPAKFKKAFQDTLSSIDFTTKEGTVQAENIVKGLIDSAKDLTKKEKEELRRAWGEAVGQIKLEAELELKAREDERLKSQVQKMFDDYNLTIELDKLGVDADEVGKLFNIDTKDLLTLERKLESMKDEFVGKGMEKEYRQFMRKIVEINDKANLEMAKKYVKYLREEYNERAKIELEYMKQRAEVYALPFDENETMRILDNLQKETQKKLDEIDWKAFTGSDMYVELFEDLSKASVRSMDYMIDQLRALKSSLSSLDPSNLKTIVDQIEKLEDELIKRDPFKVLSDSMKSWREFRKDEKTTSLINEILGRDSDAKINDFRNTLNKAIEEAKKKVDEARNKVNLQNALFGAAKQRDEAANWAVENIEGINWDNVYNLGGMQRALKEIEEERDKLSKRINAQKLIGVTSEEGLSGDEKLYLKYSKYAEYISKVVSALEALQKTGDKYTSASDLEKAWKDANGDLEQFLKNLKELESGKRSFDKIGDAAIEAGKQLADMASNMKNAYTSINEYLDSIGVATGAVGEAWKEFGSTMFDTIIQALQMIPAMVVSIVEAETAINAAAGWIGLIAEAITLVMGLAKSLAGLHDAYKQEEIDRMQKSLDRLEKTAEDLSNAFDDLFNEDKMREFDAALIRTRELAIANLNKMIETEKAKKKPDQSVIDGYQDQIDSLNDELQDGIDKFYEALGGFGSEANMKSMAESWTDAWYDAFKETGDGLSGLEDSFDEFIDNLYKKTILNKLSEKYFKDVYTRLDKILATEGGLTNNLDAFNDWIGLVQNAFDGFNEDATAAMNALSNVYGAGGGLEGLQASIQGMTEETASLIEAYLNTVRLYVADNNQLLQNLYNVMAIDNEANPMLQQLKIIAAQATSINLLLDSVVHSGGYQGNGGGSYLKVHAILES